MMIDKGDEDMIVGVPWWVFMLILFIFLSGYMSFRAMRAEKKLDQQFIEQQGNVYLERMREERQKRENQHKTGLS
ncbi:sporulation YhaL family protein [Lentibacillus daqui]|uniref:sporulation YhaL family protein n=2 Tax=Lentibacillus TaxID=175304 RepID=UPI0022B149E0|nr:sporulation YhaL family protein [Lentibacillus daqui]